MSQVSTASPVGTALHSGDVQKQRTAQLSKECAELRADFAAFKLQSLEVVANHEATVSSQSQEIGELKATVSLLADLAKRGLQLSVRSLLDTARPMLYYNLTGKNMALEDKKFWNETLEIELQKPNGGLLAELELSVLAAKSMKYGSASIQEEGNVAAHNFSKIQHAQGVEGWSKFDAANSDVLREIFQWVYGLSVESVLAGGEGQGGL